MRLGCTMAKPWIVLLGGNELNGGFVEVAGTWGASLAIVDWNEVPALPCDRHFRLDIKSTNEVLEAVRNLQGEVLFAYTSADVASETAAQINAQIGLARAPAEAIQRAGDKTAMNAAWTAAGLIGKNFAVCHDEKDLASFADNFGGKLIVKPANSSSSRGITIIEAREIYHTNWNWIFERASEAALDGVVLVEEFIEGTEFTVEMIGDDEGNVEIWGVSKKYHTQNTDRNRIAVKLHYNPSDVNRDRLERIASFGAACYRALGLKNSLGHFEVIEKPDGDLVPVELAARSSGFIATHLVSVLSGIPGAYLTRYREMLKGQAVTSRLLPTGHSSMYFFYDPPTGIWQQDGMSLMDYLPTSIHSLGNSRKRLWAGARLAPIDTDNERYGFEILSGSSCTLTINNVRAAELALYNAAVELHRKASPL